MDVLYNFESILSIIVNTYIVYKSRQNYLCYKQYNLEIEEKYGTSKLHTPYWIDIFLMVLGVVWIITYIIIMLFNPNLGIWGVIIIRPLMTVTFATTAALITYRTNGSSKCKPS